MAVMGKIGFVWWFGVVEDVNDELQVGRVRVRVHHFHNPSPDVLPTSDLPWAHVVMPTTSTSTTSIGWSPTFIQPDTTVFGFFADGEAAQMPIVLGTLPGIPQPNPEYPDIENFNVDAHDVSQLARGVNRLQAAKDAASMGDFEPGSGGTFAAQYPFNKVFETGFPGRQGHVMEFDDTPGRERVHLYHNGGSYTEMSPGLRIDKTNGTSFDLSSQAKIIKTSGDLIIVADGATTVYSEGSMTLATNGILNLSGKIINMSSQLGTSISAGAVLSMSSIGATSISAAGLIDVSAGASVSVKAAGLVSITGGSITLNSLSGLAITSTGALSLGGKGLVNLTGASLVATTTGVTRFAASAGIYLN